MKQIKFRIYKNHNYGELQDGLFHQWGTELHEDDKGFHENTIGIVQDLDGKIHKVEPEQIQFI